MYSNFTEKGDIYFYGCIIIELILGKQIEPYDLNEAKKLIKSELKENEKEILNLILQILSQVIKNNFFIFIFSCPLKLFQEYRWIFP